jgi:putative transposase
MSYPTDLTDAQWDRLEPMLQRSTGPGRPTEVDLRMIVNALLYKTRTGCQWRMLPKDFPSHNSVRYYFDKWHRDGTWERIEDCLRGTTRRHIGRVPSPQAMGGDRAPGKATNERKRPQPVDTSGATPTY